jgi:hypothetical protein
MSIRLTLPAVLPLVASLALAGCAAPTDHEDAVTGNANLDTSGAPVIPLGRPYGQRAIQGPAVVSIQWMSEGDSAADGHSINIDYVGGRFGCNGTGQGTRVGVVQNGKTVAEAPIQSSGRGGCAGYVSLDGLASGPVELYFFDNSGGFDSDGGHNYRFVLDKSIIPGLGPDGSFIPLRTGHPSVAHAGPASASIVGRDIDLDYAFGSLRFCAEANISVGVVQNGTQVARARVAPLRIFPGDWGVVCHAIIPTAGLAYGKIGFYFFDDQGHFDSNLGANYNFDFDPSTVTR